MAFDFNNIEDNDTLMDEVSKNSIRDLPVKAIISEITNIAKFAGFKEIYDDILQQNILTKNVSNPNIGLVRQIKDNLAEWTWFNSGDFLTKSTELKERLSTTVYNNFKNAVTQNCFTSNPYFKISPDNGAYFCMAFNKYRSWSCFFGLTGNVSYDIGDENSGKDDLATEIKQMNKILKHYSGTNKLPMIGIKKVDMPGVAKAFAISSNYNVDLYKATKRIRANNRLIKPLNKFINSWRIPCSKKDYPEFVLSESKGDIKWPTWSQIYKNYEYKNIKDIFMWVDVKPDGECILYFVLTNNYKHDKNGEIIN